MKKLDIAFSSCPNDTFIFHAMLHGLVNTGDYLFSPYISDVEDLNQKAFTSVYDITKLSFHAWLYLKDKYKLLQAGAAIGYGCGPLLVVKDKAKNIRDMKIAIPGEYTTAFMLLQLWSSDVHNFEITEFDKIMPGVSSGLYDGGLIIHEGRFVYEQYDLTSIVDLGQWWEDETGLPIPLGCIAIRNDGDVSKERDMNMILRSSVEYALNNRSASSDYIKLYSQEMDSRVIDEHIDLYVNQFSIDPGDRGNEAINKLEEMAGKRGILK